MNKSKPVILNDDYAIERTPRGLRIFTYIEIKDDGRLERDPYIAGVTLDDEAMDKLVELWGQVQRDP